MPASQRRHFQEIMPTNFVIKLVASQILQIKHILVLKLLATFIYFRSYFLLKTRTCQRRLQQTRVLKQLAFEQTTVNQSQRIFCVNEVLINVFPKKLFLHLFKTETN